MSEKLNKNKQKIKLLVFIVLTTSLLSAYLFPVHPDEIFLRNWLSRLPYDFPYRTTGVGRCFSEFYQLIPITQIFPAFINWLIHGLVESPTALRRVGFFIFLLWSVPLTFYLIQKVRGLEKLKSLKNPLYFIDRHFYPIAFVVSLLFVGVLPVFFVMNRSEQLFFPSIILLFLLFIYSKPFSVISHSWSKYGFLGLYFVAVSLILYGHAKALFLLPFFLIVAWKISEQFKSRKIFIFTIIFLSIISFEAYFAWVNLYQCKEMPAFDELIKSFSFDPLSIFYDPALFFDKAYHSLIRSREYLDNLIFKSEYTWNYLPHRKLYLVTKIINKLIKLNTLLIFFGLLIFMPYYYYQKNFSKGNFITPNLALIVLFSCLIINAIFNLPKNFYDADYFYVMMIIILIFFIGENALFNLKSNIFKKLLIYIILVSTLSQLAFAIFYLRPFMKGAVSLGIPIGKYENENIHNSIAKAANACNIDPIQSKHVVTDDLTYGFFRKSHGPVSFTYLFVDDQKNPLKIFFNNMDSSGMVLDCSLMPEKLREDSIRVNNICCISQKKINDLFILNKSLLDYK
jgi:hypothetical protein